MKARGDLMNIRPSAAIRQNYNEIADLCRKSSEPVFLTKNGEGDLVVMDIELTSKEDGYSVLHTLILDLKGTKFYGYHTLSKTHGKVFDGILKAIIAFSEDKVKNSSMTQFVIIPLRERYEIR